MAANSSAIVSYFILISTLHIVTYISFVALNNVEVVYKYLVVLWSIVWGYCTTIDWEVHYYSVDCCFLLHNKLVLY